MQSRLTLTLAVLLTAWVSAACGRGNAFTRENAFDADPHWTGVHNQAANNRYGFQQGEIGGTIGRTNAEGYYAETELPGNTLDTHLQASGKLRLVDLVAWDGLIQVGFRSADTADPSFLGLEILEKSDTEVRVRANVVRRDGGSPNQAEAVVVPLGTYEFAMSYDPSAGSNSAGQVSVQLTVGAKTYVAVTPLAGDDRAVGAFLDAFGIGTPPLEAHDTLRSIGVYLDDVAYSATP